MNYLIPNYIVRGSEKGNTLINQMVIDKVITEYDADKVLLIFKYLFANTTQSNTVNFTLEDMIIDCGFVPKTKKGGTNDKFKIILDYLNKNNYFVDNDIDFLNIKPKQFIKVGSNYFDTNEEGKKGNYFILDDEEIEDIYNIDNIDSNKLLLYYTTLKSRIHIKTKVTDEEPQTCYATVQDMAKDILLSDDTINQYNQILVENDLIYIDNAGKFSKIIGSKRIYKQSTNTYTLTSIKNYKAEVDKSINIYIDYMEKLGWELCNDISLSKRQIAGSVNRLKYLKQQGKLDDEGKEKLKQLQEQQNIISNTNKYDNMQLLEENPNMMLSEIFLMKDLDELSYKYQDIELNLGLVDEDFNLLVDKEYYDWVIVNYNKKEHDYYKNCVAKRIRKKSDTASKSEPKHFGKPNPFEKVDYETGEIISDTDSIVKTSSVNEPVSDNNDNLDWLNGVEEKEEFWNEFEKKHNIKKEDTVDVINQYKPESLQFTEQQQNQQEETTDDIIDDLMA